MKIWSGLYGIGVAALLVACAGTPSPSLNRNLSVGSKLLLASPASTGVLEWRSSHPEVAIVKTFVDERGVRQTYVVAKNRGVAVIEPARTDGIVGRTEVILNESEFNNRMVSPPSARARPFTLTVE